MRKSRTKSSQCAVDVIDEEQCHGVVWPTAHSILHFRGPSASLFSHGTVLWSKILRFIVTPDAMTTLCAISHAAAKASWTPATWEENCVNTSRLTPRGSRAMRHHQLWKSARYVAGGRWQYRCISLLLSRQFALWRWLEKGGSVLVADGTTYNVAN